MRRYGLAYWLSLSICAPALAQWRDHPELPDWCQRGKVRWVHGFSKMDMARVNMLIDMRLNLKQSGAFANAAAAERARQGGLRYQPYICSKTLRWQRLFKTHPQLKDACCLDPKGERRLMYGNPARYAGCYRSPLWRAYIKERITQTVNASHPDSIFFDNFNCYDCYCPLCQKAFPDFTRKLLGKAMTLDGSRRNPNFRFAKLMFDAHAALDFFAEMRAYLKQVSPTPVMISPNCHVGVNWHAYLASLDVNDLVFYEEGYSFPPFTRQIYGYKMGLAASHGKVVGQLVGLPATVAEERALRRGKDWQFHQPEVKEAFTYPEEYQLAIAEGAACDGTCIPSTNIREQKINPSNQPHQVAVRAAIKKYEDFLVEHQDLYALAKPGSSTAVLYSIWTQLHNRKAQQLRRLTTDLMRAGIPFEIVTEDDLNPESLRPYKGLILSGVENLSDADAAAVEAFARAGGRVLLVGECAKADRLGVARAADKRGEFWTSRARSRAEGAGQVAWLASWPVGLSGTKLRSQLENQLGPPRIAIEPSDTLVLNLLQRADGKCLEAHLLNYDFHYQRPKRSEIADDCGLGQARTYLARTAWRARKVLVVPDPQSMKQPVVRFFGRSPGTDRFQLVVSLNGKDLKTFAGTALHNSIWHEAPAGDALKAGKNVVEFRVIGSPNANPDYFNLRIDTRASSRRSFWSLDNGKTFADSDLSPDRGAQTGEYLVRIADKANLKDTFTPADFAGKLKIVPATNVDLTVPASLADWRATAMSPDHEPIALKPMRQTDSRCVFSVPSVRIYEVVTFEPPR